MKVDRRTSRVRVVRTLEGTLRRADANTAAAAYVVATDVLLTADHTQPLQILQHQA